MDRKVAALTYGVSSSSSSPCSEADPKITTYLTNSVDRLLYRGLPFAEDETLEQILVEDADATYEV